MKVDLLFYIEKGVTDEDLTFMGDFLPATLPAKLSVEAALGRVFFSGPSAYQGALKGNGNFFTRADVDDAVFWKDLFTRTGASHIAKIFADSPFLDPALIAEMAAVHLEYLAEFTYSESLPQGFSCEIISRELVDAIPDSEQKTLPISQVIKSNINQFDVEIFYKDPDIRARRLSFRSGNPRDKKIMEHLAAPAGGPPPYAAIADAISDNPAALYAGPSYLEIELTGRCDLDCLFCYRTTLPAPRGDMDLAVLGKILADMASFGLPYTICFGGSGEPLLHPKFYEALSLVCADDLVNQVIVETCGTLAGGSFASFLEKPEHAKVRVIVNINGYDETTYRDLHHVDAFPAVYENIIGLKRLNDSGTERVFIQVMKINETEPFLDRYYDFWEKTQVPIILQKQNTYLGRIKDRRYSDLTPLERTPCWHLQRDLFITSDGTVSFCKQDFGAQHYHAGAAHTPLAEIWRDRQSSFLNDFRASYPNQPDCAKCDEWYTFNF